MFGERPAHPRQGEQYDRGVREVARYRIEHDVLDETPGLGPEPDDRHVRTAWRRANTTVRQVQRRLGLSVDRDRGAGHEL